jgi:serine/threonine protein kinase
MTSTYRSRRSSLGGAIRVKAIAINEDDDCSDDNYKENTSSSQHNFIKSPLKSITKPNSKRESFKSSADKVARSVSNTDMTEICDEPTISIKPEQNPMKDTRRSSYDTIFRESISSTATSSSERYSGSDDNASFPDRCWRVEDFTLGKPLGKGKFGNVYQAKQKRVNMNRFPSIALKVLFKQPMIDANCVKNLKREVEIHRLLKHPNIIEFRGLATDKLNRTNLIRVSSYRCFSDAKNVYLILEHASGGELFKYVHQQGGRVSESQCKTYMKDIASAVDFMHMRNVIHRDIKLENILIGENGKLRLADFGWAVHALPPNDTRFTMCGTPEYLAPEMIAGNGHNHGVDLWALGILLHELLLGRLARESTSTIVGLIDICRPRTPFAEVMNVDINMEEDQALVKFEAQHRISQRIMSFQGRLDFHSYDSRYVSKQAKDVIRSLLQPVSNARLTANELLQTGWLSESMDESMA